MRSPQLSLVLPVHNQESIISPVTQDIVKTLKNSKIDYEIILVENGSTDQTYQSIKKLTLKNPRIKAIRAAKGYGSAIIKGLNQTKGRYVSYMPSDGQLDPDLLPKLYKLITAQNYDLVKIKRSTRESRIRKIRSKVFNLLARILFKITVVDINGSPRIFLRNWLPILKIKSRDSFIDAEMAIKVYYLGWKIKEIPALTLPRKGGKSTVSFKTVIEFLKNFIDYKKSYALKLWIKSVT